MRLKKIIPPVKILMIRMRFDNIIILQSNLCSNGFYLEKATLGIHGGGVEGWKGRTVVGTGN